MEDQREKLRTQKTCCPKCGSTNLWWDLTAYGCNTCNWLRCTGDDPVLVVENGTGRVRGIIP